MFYFTPTSHTLGTRAKEIIKKKKKEKEREKDEISLFPFLSFIFMFCFLLSLALTLFGSGTQGKLNSADLIPFLQDLTTGYLAVLQ